MGYFGNGTEGMMYQEKYCQRCVHDGACPVMDFHLLYNGANEGTTEAYILNALIPKEGIHNGQCTMFYEGKSQMAIEAEVDAERAKLAAWNEAARTVKNVANR